MSRPACLCCALLLGACEPGTTPAPVNPGPGLVGTPQTPVPAPADPAAGGDSQAGDPSALPMLATGVVLPAGWSGLGVLAAALDPPVKRAPEWTRVAAQVVLRDGRRYLEATGRAERIKNAALARSAAENRARAELARWLGHERMEGSTVAESLIDPRTHTAFARVAIEVPEGWMPGQAFAPTGVAPAAPAPPSAQP